MKYNLLSTNAKLEKQNGQTYLVAGLSMAPHSIGGEQVCPDATFGCRSTCVLWFTGRTVMPITRNAMLRRKSLFFDEPKEFERQLREDIEKHIQQAHDAMLTPAIRLNVASDLDWSAIARDYPLARFYDYSKVKSRLRSTDWPEHYELTYSLNEQTHWRTARAQLDRGGNVAVVFSTRYHPQSGRIDDLPDAWVIGNREYRVVDGDKHDIRLREVDGSAVIVGLRFKGSLKRRALAIAQGFCIDVESN